MAITSVGRGHVTVQTGDKSVTVCGEMLGPAPGRSDFLIYAYLIDYWDEPYSQIMIGSDEKKAILEEICDHLKNLEFIPEVMFQRERKNQQKSTLSDLVEGRASGGGTQ